MRNEGTVSTLQELHSTRYAPSRNGLSEAPEMARAQWRTLDNADINPRLSAHWLRHAHANRVLDIFRAVSKGVSAGLSRQHQRAAHALLQTLKTFGPLEN